MPCAVTARCSRARTRSRRRGWWSIPSCASTIELAFTGAAPGDRNKPTRCWGRAEGGTIRGRSHPGREGLAAERLSEQVAGDREDSRDGEGGVERGCGRLRPAEPFRAQGAAIALDGASQRDGQQQHKERIQAHRLHHPRSEERRVGKERRSRW